MNKTSLKKVLCAVLAATMSTTLLASCGKKGGGSNVATADKDGNVTLTVTDWENEDTNKAMEKAFAEYTESTGGKVKVKIQAAPLGDYGTKLTQMVSSGTAPDIFQVGHDMGVTFFQNNLLYDWTEKADAEPDLASKYAPNTYDKWRFAESDQKWSGKQFGLPGLLNVYGIYYNKDLLAQAGLDNPTDDWTLDDMYSYAETLVSKGVSEYGLYGMTNDIFQVAMQSVANGGAHLSEEIIEPTEITMDQTFKDMVARLQGLIKSKAINPPTYEMTNIQDVFRQGQAPMLYYGQWFLADLIKNSSDTKFEWDYVAFPKGSAKQAMMYDCTGWASPNNIKAVDEVWELMKYMSGDMYKVVLADQPVAASAYNDSANAFYDAVKAGGHEASANAVERMVNCETKTMLRFYPKWKDNATKIVNASWNNILEGKADISEIDNIVKGVNDVIAKG